MIKKLIMSLLIITGVGAGAFAATQALFTDTATLAANTISTGTVNLLVNSGKTGGTFEDSKSGFFTETLLPGETATKFFRLRNENSSVALSIAAQAVVAGGGSIPANQVNVTFTAVNSSDVAVGTPVTKTLADWATVGELGLPNILSNTTQRYKMDVEVEDTVTTSGSTVTFDFVFTGTQVVTTPTPSVSPSISPTP